MEKLLDVQQVSQLLGIKESTLRAWIFQNRIPVVRIGRLVRFKENDLQSWIEKSSVPTNEDNGLSP